MRRLLVSVAALLVWAGPVSAGEIMVKVPADEYQATKDQLKSMQGQIKKLQKDVAVVKGEAGQLSSSKLRKMDRDISDIYDTLDEVETKTIKDRINIGAELRVRMDNYRVKDYDQPGMTMYYVPAADDGTTPNSGWQTTPHASDERNDGNWTSRMRLNLDSEVSRSVKFHGRLALFKNWADSQPGYSDDTMRSHRPSGDTNLKVDRFYVDWIPQDFFLPIAVTIGRQPTTDGPPYEFKEDRERQSTYPALIFDGEPDGVVVTLGLERWTGLKNSALRYFYAMAFQYDNDTQNYLDGIYQADYQDVKVHGIFFETEIPGLRDSLLVADYIMAKDFFAADPKPIGMGGSGSMANIGDMDIWGLHIQLRDIGGNGIDLFGSYGENRSDPNGNIVTMNTNTFGLLGNGTGKEKGHAFYTGLRYTIPVKALNEPKIGIEYNKGSQYWFSFTPGSTELYNKLAARGECFDYYYIQPINKNMFMRTGYTQIEYDYSGSGSYLGTPVDYSATYGKTPKFENFYVLIDTRF